jgi:hypothetical protein
MKNFELQTVRSVKREINAGTRKKQSQSLAKVTVLFKQILQKMLQEI